MEAGSGCPPPFQTAAYEHLLQRPLCLTGHLRPGLATYRRTHQDRQHREATGHSAEVSRVDPGVTETGRLRGVASGRRRRLPPGAATGNDHGGRGAAIRRWHPAEEEGPQARDSIQRIVAKSRQERGRARRRSKVLYQTIYVLPNLGGRSAPAVVGIRLQRE